MSSQQSEIDWSKAITAGAVATVAMTVVGLIFKMDIMKAMGTGMVGEDGGAMIYVVGGIAHLMIGLIYGVIYASIAPKLPLPAVVSGLMFGAILTPIAIYGSPVMMKMMPNAVAGNPCGASNPCGENPCEGANPCNPCADSPCSKENPCGENPCAGNPCGKTTSVNDGWVLAFQAGDNPCAANPCAAGNPCAPADGTSPWVSSGISHLAFGLILGLLYKPKGS